MERDAGKRFLKAGGDEKTLTLSDVKTNGAGVVMLTYTGGT